MSTNTSESLVRGEMVVRTPEGIALKIMQSEAMMWLMVGANHPDCMDFVLEARMGRLRSRW